MNRDKQIQLSFTLPYGERAAIALLAEAHRTNINGNEYRQATKVALRTTLRGRKSSKDRERTSVLEVNASGGLLRKAAGRSGSRVINLRAMHASKVSFDHRVSTKIRSETGMASATIGFPGACLRTFKSIGPDSLKVFHAVDAHPLSHNEALLQSFSSDRARAELYPGWVVKRIQSELETADLVLVPSRLVAQQMIHHNVDPTKVLVRPYGVDFGRFDVRDDFLEPNTARPKIIYVGQISLRKGITHLLEIAPSVDADFILVGTVFDRDILRNSPNNVSHVEAVTHDQLANMLTQADAFVIPSIEDACSLVALEAAASGLPVIATANNGVTEILPAQSTSIVQVGVREHLLRTLQKVEILHPSTRSENARRTRQSAVVDWQEYARSTVKSIVERVRI